MNLSYKGFSFIEVVVVVAIVAIVSIMGSVFYSRFLVQNSVSNTVDNLVSQLRKAQLYAMSGKQNSNWGVHFDSSIIYLYKGNSFAGRDTAFDETFPVYSNIAISGINDINFAKISGIPTNGGSAITNLTIGIVGPNNTSRTVIVNSQGAVARGDPLSPPGVTTSAATNITTTTTTLNGSANPNEDSAIGWFRYSSTDPGSCNDSFGTRVPAGTGGTSLGAGSADVNFSQNIIGLSASTTYYFCAISSNGGGVGYGSKLNFDTADPISPPVVTTKTLTVVDTTSATLEGSANPNADGTIGWFRYSNTDPGSCNDNFGTRAPVSGGDSLGAGNSPADYPEDITGLSHSTTYYYCAIASNGGGVGMGDVLFFTTPTPVIEYVASTSTASNNPTSGSFSLPGGAVPGDLAVFWWFTMTNTKNFTPPAAITQKQQVSAATCGAGTVSCGRLYIGYRRLQAGDTTFAWTSGTSSNSTTVWGTSVFKNVFATGDPFEAQSGTPVTFSNIQNPDPPVVTTLSPNAMVMSIYGKRDDFTAITPPSGYASAGSNDATLGNDASAGAAYFLRPSAGSENPGAWTLTGGAANHGYIWTGALKPL